MPPLSPAPLIVLDHATIVRPGDEVGLRAVHWTVREGECWAIVGPVASGKTTLAEALLGRFRLDAGSIEWPMLAQLRAHGRAVAWPSEVIKRVSFKEESWRFSYGRHYYQQRFNFIEAQDDLTLDDFLRSGTAATEEALHAVCLRLGLEALRGLSLIKLSNGETRRARLARALLSHPEMLILDEPFLGVDHAGRSEVATMLGTLIDQGLKVVLITRPAVLPEWVTHVLELDQLAVRWQGTRAEFLARLPRQVERSVAPPDPPPPRHGPPIIELRQVNVTYGERAILRDVSWTVHAGERWAVLGPNGSGKTTLLSLLCGDHPQAYSNDLWLFGRKRGTGESIWDIKHKVGLLSPELHFYFTEPLTAARTAATGFFDVLVPRHTTPAQDAVVRQLFEEFGIAALAERPFARLSTGEQRLVLLIRALVKEPPLLILDEPMQGLDDPSIARVRSWLEERLHPEQTLLFVSHYANEIPRTITHWLRLDNGRVSAS